MAFRKLAEAASNLENFARIHTDRGFCCDDAEKTVNTVANSAHDLTANGIDSIVIDGTTYPFAATADTQAALKTAIEAAFASAFYTEVEGVAGVAISGAAAATVVTINTTATVTKMVDAASNDIAFS